MRRVVNDRDDKCLGRIADGPPLKYGDIVRLGKVNYRVTGVSDNRKESEVYVDRESVAWTATPDHKLELTE